VSAHIPPADTPAGPPRRSSPIWLLLQNGSLKVGALSEKIEEFLSDDIANALRRSAAARMLEVMRQIISVIECDLLASADRFDRNNPDLTGNSLRFTVRRTTMVKKPGRILRYVSIEIKFLIKIKDEAIAFRTTPTRLGLVDLLADVLEHERPRQDVPRRESTQAMYRRVSDLDQWRLPNHIALWSALVHCAMPKGHSPSDRQDPSRFRQKKDSRDAGHIFKFQDLTGLSNASNCSQVQ
jgi:hypothetical protein